MSMVSSTLKATGLDDFVDDLIVNLSISRCFFQTNEILQRLYHFIHWKFNIVDSIRVRTVIPVI